ncbi:MAG: OsmC family protein [Bacteroidota bacterium]
MEAHYYNVDLKWMTDRKGIIYSPELKEEIEVATPPQFAKGIKDIWSPEHLLTAAVNSCFMTTFLAIAENSRLEFSNFECQAKGKLEQLEGKFLMTEVLLEATLKISNEADKEKAERILQKSEAACLISNSIRAKVFLQTNIIF